jgi:hypothetical protein
MLLGMKSVGNDRKYALSFPIIFFLLDNNTETIRWKTCSFISILETSTCSLVFFFSLELELRGLISKQWKEMGWQGKEPSTDFR